MGKSHAALVVQRPEIVLLVDNKPVAKAPVSSDTVRMRIDVRDGGQCTFNYAEPGQPFKVIGDPFQATKSAWTGATIGVFARTLGGSDGYADFDYFRFAPPPTAP